MTLAGGIPKFIFYINNTLFLFSGIVLLAVGVEYKWYLDDFAPLHPTMQYYLNLAPSGMIVIGASISFIALWGYWGAAVESNFIISSYFMFIMTLVVSQIVLGSMGIVQVRNSDGVLGRDIHNKTVELYEKYETDDHAKWLIDYIQQELFCCGVEGPSYWNSNSSDVTVPKSCCSPCSDCRKCTEGSAFRDGCNGRILYAYQKCVRVVGGVFIGLTLFELTGMIVSCFMIGLLNKNKQYFGMDIGD